MTKVIKYVFIVMATLMVAMVLMLAGRAIQDRQIDYEVDPGETAIPTFREQTLSFTNSNDGDLDLVIAQDTGQVRTWKNTGQRFELVDNPNSNFYSYPMGIAVADYDNNGLVDFFFSNVGTTPPHFVHANLAGASRVFLSTGGDSGFLKIRLPDTVESVGAMVTVTRDDGTILHLPYVSGEGLCSDSSRVIFAGLGDATATKVSVKYIDGRTDEREGNFRNATLEL